MLNNNPVLVARHCCNIETFFKEKKLGGPLGKTKKDALCIEFLETGSPHVNSFIWIFHAPNIHDETTYNEFIENTLDAQF